jgi:hypothetical protein
MMGSYFELNREYADTLFKTIFSYYELKSSNYFKVHREDESKIYLDLKSILLDIMAIYGVSKNKIRGK